MQITNSTFRSQTQIHPSLSWEGWMLSSSSPGAGMHNCHVSKQRKAFITAGSGSGSALYLSLLALEALTFKNCTPGPSPGGGVGQEQAPASRLSSWGVCPETGRNETLIKASRSQLDSFQARRSQHSPGGRVFTLKGFQSVPGWTHVRA